MLSRISTSQRIIAHPVYVYVCILECSETEEAKIDLVCSASNTGSTDTDIPVFIGPFSGDAKTVKNYQFVTFHRFLQEIRPNMICFVGNWPSKRHELQIRDFRH
jgi:hypothetical protein